MTAPTSQDVIKLAGIKAYREQYGVNRRFPEVGRDRAEVMRELREMAAREDDFWQTGRCSGSLYSGNMDHYGFLNEAAALYSHVNALQRDICPSASRFESEIIAMTLELMHGDAAGGSTACGAVTSGGTDSIMSAVLAHREWARRERDVRQPQMILPRTAHPAFEKAAHLFGVEVVVAPIDPLTTGVEIGFVREHITDRTIMLVGSAGNYPYGTIDPIERLSELAVAHRIGLHVDGCLGGFILPWGEALGYEIPVFDFRLPGVTSISADTHKYGYGLKGTSVVLYRDKALREGQYFISEMWPGGKYFSPGLAGSRPVGLLAATWASMVSLGRAGYMELARAIFETSFAMQAEVARHAELRMMGVPTFCFSFTSEAFDIYHVNDFLRGRGWRMNGQQYPNAIHMCVTGPQTQPGVVEAFGRDLTEAVAYATDHRGDPAASAAVYGGIPEDMPDAQSTLRRTLVQLIDRMHDLPRE
jgi:glutamate/tyrosine decarboxylase-like PLP-dependent enzyme